MAIALLAEIQAAVDRHVRLVDQHIAQRIEELLDDAELRRRLGRAARETILDRYDVRDCVRRQADMIYGAMK